MQNPSARIFRKLPLLRRPLALPLTTAAVVGLYGVAAAAGTSHAKDVGRPDCRVVAVAPVPLDTVEWKGGCKHDYADGPGVLTWRGNDGKTHRLEATMVRGEIHGEAVLELGSGVMYSGTFKDGLPNGMGAFADPDGAIYQGEVRDGQRNGTGIGISPTGDRYEGQWLNDKPEGQGRMKYALGGEYAGQWHAGKRHGHGVLTYAGGDRRFEGKFEDGYIAGKAPAAVAIKKYVVVDHTASGSAFPQEVARGSPVPGDVGYAQLTAEQKQIVNSSYAALEDGDEPPYPLEGPKDFYKTMGHITARLRLSGNVTIYANVGADGKVATIGMVGLDTPELRRHAAAAAAAIRFKPAICRGKPCPMRYGFRLRLMP